MAEEAAYEARQTGAAYSHATKQFLFSDGNGTVFRDFQLPFLLAPGTPREAIGCLESLTRHCNPNLLTAQAAQAGAAGGAGGAAIYFNNNSAEKREMLLQRKLQLIGR